MSASEHVSVYHRPGLLHTSFYLFILLLLLQLLEQQTKENINIGIIQVLYENVYIHKLSRIDLIFTSAKEVMFSSAFVCLLAGLAKTTHLICTKFDGKVAREPRKKWLEFGGNPDHITLGLCYG